MANYAPGNFACVEQIVTATVSLTAHLSDWKIIMTNVPHISAKLTKRTRLNALRNAQVVPPHRVDLTLNPSTLEQMRAPFGVNSRASPVIAKH